MELSLYTEFDYLNSEFNEQFLSRKLSRLEFIDKDIISNGSASEEKALNIISQGKVRVVRPGLRDAAIAMYQLGVGNIFGMEAILMNGAEMPMIVSAVGEVVVYRIVFEDIIEQMKDINVLQGLFKHYIKTVNGIVNI